MKASLLRSTEMESRRSVTVEECTISTRVFVVATGGTHTEQLRTDLARRGYNCLLVSGKDGAIERIAERSAGVALVEMEEGPVGSAVWESGQRMRQEMNIPVIGLVSREGLNRLDWTRGVDDFAVRPWDVAEVAARIERVLRQKNGIGSEEVIRRGDLVIDSARCEVSLSGKPVVLTFKEYQLLKFLASNKEKVYTREALLNKVWGWDYYGGDRTVDVHVRRLRSKIEDMNHSFIETIRNVGYRFIATRA